MQYSIVNYSVIRNQEDIRIDADYYSPQFLKIETRLALINSKEFNCYIDLITDGKHGGVTFTENGVRFLRNTNAKEFLIDDSEILYISDQESSETKRAEVSEGHILYTSIGTIGEVLVVPSYVKRANINQNLVKIIIKNDFSPYYISTFLNCKYGKSQSIRLGGGNVQGIINYPKIKTIKIFYPKDTNLINAIEKIYQQAIKAFYNSTLLYKQAEQIILFELDLVKWKPEHRLSFVKNFSDTQASERFDAEYFQPMYEEILSAVKNYKHGFDSVKKLFKQNRNSFKIKPDVSYQYVEIGSVNTSSGEIETLCLDGKDLPVNAKIKLNAGDLIISKVRTYRGAVAIVQNDNLVGSGAFTVLQESGKINKETAYVYFKSAPVLKLSLKYNAGTSYPVIDDTDILNLPFPLIPDKVQQNIKQKITEMYNVKKLSKHLLDIAKRGVETAIEKSEKDAQKWIDAEVKKLDVEL